MSVTPEVSHVEMWPYVAAAAVASASHAATAVLMVLSVIAPSHARAAVFRMPHDVDAHGVPVNALPRSTLSRHQPRSWSKAEAPLNMYSIVVTLWSAQPLMSWSKAEALKNIPCIDVTPEVSHAPMSL